MMTGILHGHKGLSYILVALLLFALIGAIGGMMRQKLSNGDKKVGLFLLITSHIQLLLGVVLWSQHWSSIGEYMSVQSARMRYLEHPILMILFVVLATIAHSKTKKATAPMPIQRTRTILYGACFVIVLLMVAPLWAN